jgi:hypothetical protein
MSLTNFDQDQSRTSLANCSNEVNSTVATPEEFVTKYGGKRVIKKILIANNGIAGTYTFLGFYFQNNFRFATGKNSKTQKSLNNQLSYFGLIKDNMDQS